MTTQSAQDTKRRLTLTDSMLVKILERQAIHDLTHALSRQDTPFKRGESLVVLGSGVGCLEGYAYPAAMPIDRPPSDLDLMLYEPQGEESGRVSAQHGMSQRYQVKLDKSGQCRHLLEKAAAETGAAFSPRSKADDFNDVAETVGSQEYIMSKNWSPGEINRVLAMDSTRQLLRRFYKDPKGEFELAPRTQPMHTSTQVHVMAYPASLLPPRPLEGIPDAQPGKIRVMADNELNCLALKLVRLMLPAQTGEYARGMPETHTAKISDLVDISDILRLREAKGAPPLDPDVLRILVIAQLAGHPQKMIAKGSVTKLEPTPEHLATLHADILEKGMPHVAPERLANITRRAYDLARSVFPQASPENPLPLTADDHAFFGIAKGTLQEGGQTHPALLGRVVMGKKEQVYAFARPHLAAVRLAGDRPAEMDKVTAQCPDFVERLSRYWHMRPVHGGMNEAMQAGVLQTR